MTKISVIIPTLNAGPRFSLLLESLRCQKLETSLEIVVIDSASSDPTLAVAKHFDAKTLSIPRKSFNHGATRNLAIANSTGELIVLMSQDALPANEFLLGNLARNFRDESVAGAYARHEPRPDHDAIIQANVREHSGSLERRENFLADAAAFASMSPLDRFLISRFDNVCACICRRVWEEIPFSPRDFAEDLDWSRRVLLAGHKIVYDPAALIIHSHDLTLRDYYARVRETHAALRALFGLRLISRRREIPGRFAAEFRRQWAHIHGLPVGLFRKINAIPPLVLRSLATVLATCNGARDRASKRAQTNHLNGASTHPIYPILTKL